MHYLGTNMHSLGVNKVQKLSLGWLKATNMYYLGTNMHSLGVNKVQKLSLGWLKATNMYYLGTNMHSLGVNKIQRCTFWKSATPMITVAAFCQRVMVNMMLTVHNTSLNFMQQSHIRSCGQSFVLTSQLNNNRDL